MQTGHEHGLIQSPGPSLISVRIFRRDGPPASRKHFAIIILALVYTFFDSRCRRAVPPFDLYGTVDTAECAPSSAINRPPRDEDYSLAFTSRLTQSTSKSPTEYFNLHKYMINYATARRNNQSRPSAATVAESNGFRLFNPPRPGLIAF